jgi:hypothetical protein
LRLARDPAISDDELLVAVRAVLDQLPMKRRDAAILRAQELLAEQRQAH